MSVTSVSINNRTTFGNRIQLRRQKTCTDVFNTNNKYRDRKSFLQRQISIDTSSFSSSFKQSYDQCANGPNNSASNSSDNSNKFSKPVVNNNETERKYIYPRVERAGNTNPTDSNSETSVSKRRSQASTKNGSETKERCKKPTNDRLNINIFLNHSPNSIEQETVGSELDYPNVSTEILTTTKKYQNEDNKSNSPEIKEDNTSPMNISTADNNSNKISSKQNLSPSESKSSSNRDGNNNNSILPAPSTTTLAQNVEFRRPPLVRAMSAPIRPIDDSSKIQVKKKLRKKKLATREREVEIIETTITETNDELKNIVIKKLSRPRSAMGCDVVTLVSLLSSGGSDSEKEDVTNNKKPIENKTIIRAPLLKKTGKSVSFQEAEDSSVVVTTKEFPNFSYRRRCMTSLSAEIASNRPPTAPAGSSSFRNYEKGLNENGTQSRISSRHEISTAKETKEDDELSTIPIDEDNKKYPLNVQTSKERECWELYQKILNRGVSVSYDTILRGMLTPTELRVIQNQRVEILEPKYNNDEEEQIEIREKKAI